MHYWLMKSEPTTFSLDDLKRKPKQTHYWDGVRNYQARNMMRDQMQLGDLAFFYHSNCQPPGIVGIAEVVKLAYPDFTAFDPNDPHFDPKSDPDKPRWWMVDVKFKAQFKRMVTLEELRQQPALAPMRLLQRGNRLSILPITEREWEIICRLVSSY